MTNLILIPAVLGAVLSAVVGTVWYSPKTPMGRLHMRSLGFDKLSPEAQAAAMEAAKPQMKKWYAGQFVLSLLTALATSLIVVMSLSNGVGLPLAIGFVVFNWLGFIVPVIGTASIWGPVDRAIVWKKFFSDISYHLVMLLLVGLIAGVAAGQVVP